MTEINVNEVDFFENEYGKWKREGITETLLESTQKWHDDFGPQPEPLPEPTIEEQLAARDAQIAELQQENTMLQMGLMEMTMYTASQDERLQTQENAVMELSMLVAGGGS